MSDILETYEKDNQKACDAKIKREYVQEKELENKYRRLKSSEETIKHIDEIPIEQESPEKILSELDELSKIIPTPTLYEGFSEIALLRQGTFTVFGATSNSGKTSLSSNLIASFLQQGKKVLLLSPETPRRAVYNGVISCIVGYDYIDTKKNNPNKIDKDEINNVLKLLSENLYCYDQSSSVDSSYLENYIGMIKKHENLVDVIICDYLQCVTNTASGMQTYQVIQNAAVELDKVVQRQTNLISIGFCQIKPLPKEKKERVDFQERIWGSKAIFQKAHEVIEIERRPDFETWFRVHKTRSDPIVQVGYGCKSGYNIVTRSYVDSEDEDFLNQRSNWKTDDKFLEDTTEDDPTKDKFNDLLGDVL